MKKITLLIVLLAFGQFTKAQNTCDAAFPITTSGLYVVDAVNGTDVPTIICAENGNVNLTAAEWYTYTPTEAYTVTISTNITQNTPRVDTRVHVYTGTCGAFTCLAGDDDSGTNYSSITTFNVEANSTYYIVFDNRWSSSGFTFQLTEGNLIEPPANLFSFNATTITTINSSYNYCAVDMNGDYLDDIVGVSFNNLRIHYQLNTGAFTVVDIPITGTFKQPTWSMAAGDCNRDGYNDLILGSGSGLSVLRSENNGTAFSNFTPGEYIFCQRTNFADLNNDGNLDVFSCHDIAPNCYYLNDSNNGLTYYQSNTTPGAMNFGILGGNYSTLFTDFDNDGDSDVFISKCSGPPCELHRNDGNGVYTDISAIAQINVTPIETWSSAIADFDNDGDMDIIITASAGTFNHKYFRNNLDTTNNSEEAYTNITAGSGWDLNPSISNDNVAYDFDNDGYVDVLCGDSKIMFNQGNSTFSSLAFSGLSIGAIADLNNDGFLDVLNGSTIRYAVPNTNKWLTIALQGIQSNSNGIGARIEIYGAWGKQIRDVRSGEGFRYMSTLNAHFGLGQATTIDQIVIKWPSGVIDTLYNITSNQLLTIVEGSSLAIDSYTSNQLIVYPNPVKHIINLEMLDSTIVLKSAEIFDLNGRRVLEQFMSNKTISVEKLAVGTYILVVRDGNNKPFIQKFIKE